MFEWVLNWLACESEFIFKMNRSSGWMDSVPFCRIRHQHFVRTMISCVCLCRRNADTNIYGICQYRISLFSVSPAPSLSHSLRSNSKTICILLCWFCLYKLWHKWKYGFASAAFIFRYVCFVYFVKWGENRALNVHKWVNKSEIEIVVSQWNWRKKRMNINEFFVVQQTLQQRVCWGAWKTYRQNINSI